MVAISLALPAREISRHITLWVVW